MSRQKRWSQYLCAECQHVNFVPVQDIDPVTIPCAHCGHTALTVLENVFRVMMPKFRAGGSYKPGQMLPTSNT